MHVVLDYALLLLLFLKVPPLVLVQYYIFELESLLGVGVLLIEDLELFREGLGVVGDEGLPVYVGGGEFLISVLAVLQLVLESQLVVLFLFVLVVELGVDWVVLVGPPVLL